jgi:hypothetical protein
MSVILSGETRSRLRTVLSEHRARSIMTDADYCEDMLRVSLNTFKKCIGSEPHLSLKRHTLTGLLARIGTSLPELEHAAATTPVNVDYGGYTRESHGYLEGRYMVFRRHFSRPENITRAVLDIAWDTTASALRWSELRRFRSEATGEMVANDMHGHVTMHQERILMGLLCVDRGDARLTLLHVPPRHAFASKLGFSESLGVVVTHGYPKRFFQPVVSPIAIKSVEAKKRHAPPETLCKILTPGTTEFETANRHLCIAEEQSCEMTSLTWRSLKGSA